MRLYLSSFRLGGATEELVRLVRRPGRAAVVGVIANAVDDADDARRSDAVAAEVAALSSLGLMPLEIDLRRDRDQPDRLRRELARCAALWVRGGNVFMLRMAMRLSGADELIRDLVYADALVYAGYSAGPCVLAPSLRGLESIDDPAPVRRRYGSTAPWSGLGVLDRPFVPHVDSPGHPETERADRLAAAYRSAGVPHWALSDGQVLVVDGSLTDAVVL